MVVVVGVEGRRRGGVTGRERVCFIRRGGGGLLGSCIGYNRRSTTNESVSL